MAVSPSPSGGAARGPLRGRCSVAACVLAGWLAGAHLAQLSGVLELGSFGAAFPGLSAWTKSGLSAALLLGAFAATPAAGPLCDARGRGAALALAGALFLAGATMIAGAQRLAHVALGRAAAGAGYALGNVAAPAYLAEAAPRAARARYVNGYQASVNAGILSAQLLNAVAAPATPWRVVALAPAIPAAALAVLAARFFAEPAAWLARARDADAPGAAAAAALANMRRDPSAPRRLRVAGGLMLAQQLTGVNGVILYAPALLMSLGLGGAGAGPAAPFWAGAAVGASNFVASAAAMAAMERVGRRALLLAGAALIGCALLVLGAVRQNGGPAAAGVGALVLFIAAFAGSFGPLPFLIAAEVFPVRYRGVGLTVVGMVSHASSFVVVSAFLQLERSIGHGVYVVFAACIAGAALFVHRYVPETRGLTLQNIDALFGGNGASSEAEFDGDRP